MRRRSYSIAFSHPLSPSLFSNVPFCFFNLRSPGAFLLLMLWSLIPYCYVKVSTERRAYRTLQADWNPGKHNVASRMLMESPEVLLQGCGIDSKKQEMLDVDQGKVGHAPLQQLMTGMYG